MQIHIDVPEIENIALTGIRRAAAFIGLGLKAIGNEPPHSVTLSNHLMINFLPDPLPRDLAQELAIHYRTWLAGGGLRELDQHFSLFLDRVWETCRLGELHGKPPPPMFLPDERFSADTNVARKLARVIKHLGAEAPWAGYFDGFSRARNALNHNAGVIRDRDSNCEDGLMMKWRSPTIIIQDGDVEHIIDARVAPPSDPTENEASVYFRLSEREALVRKGERIEFSPVDLAEICLCYQATANALARALHAYLVDLGLVI